MQILSKILIIITIAIMLLSLLQTTIYAAIQIDIDKAYIETTGFANNHLKYYRENLGRYTYHNTFLAGYRDKDGTVYPVYCIDRTLPGADKEPYYVTIDNLLDNDEIWRIIKNGYPYKTAKEWGLTDEKDLYAITRFAIYCVLGQTRLDYFMADDNDPEGLVMMEGLKKLVDIGKNGTEKQDDNPLKPLKVGEFKEKGEYYIQEYKVNSTSDFSKYKIEQIKNMPDGGVLIDKNGSEKIEFKKGENFFLKIPKTSLKNNLDIEIKISAECKAYVILEGKTTVSGTQNYVVTAGENAKATANISFKENVNTGKIIINKTDKDKKTPLEGIEFKLVDENGQVVDTQKTNEKGVAEFKNLVQGKYKVIETKTQENYVLPIEEHEVNVEYNKTITINKQNEKIKGQIKIIKTSKDNNKITGEKAGTPLKGVEFEIYNSKDKLVEKIKTDNKGIAITSRLEKGQYKIKEVKTNKWYYLNEKQVTAEIEENGQIVEIKIDNESKNPDVYIEKMGTEKAEVGSEIEYDISVKNNGNTKLSDFTWVDKIPKDYINVKKFKTGTYNQKTKYNLYYKTNLSDGYILLMEDLDSTENYEIDFGLELLENEYVTELKIQFDEVDIGFGTNENPHITAQIRKNVKSESVFENNVNVVGKYDGHRVISESKCTTFAYKLLPKTGC